MEIISNQYESREEINYKNMTQLYLEASLNKKVEKPTVQIFKQNMSFREMTANTISYKIWLYNPDILRDAKVAITKGEIIPGRSSSSSNFPKILKFNLGHIDIEEVKKANMEFLSGSSVETNKLQIVLAQVFIGKMHTHMINNDEVNLSTLDVSKLNLQNEKNDCFYLCKANSADNYTSDENKYKHIFAIKDFKKITYLSLVSFNYDNEVIKCSICNESKEDLRYVYCHNDEKYFCSNCDEEYHVKPNFKILLKHKRTLYTSFSITHQLTCHEHLLKPYEFYCIKCNSVYCIKCLTDGQHKDYSDHQIKYLNDVFTSFDQESKSLIERAKQINTSISQELDIKDKSAK